jgi:hypothetical protein
VWSLLAVCVGGGGVNGGKEGRGVDEGRERVACSAQSRVGEGLPLPWRANKM